MILTLRSGSDVKTLTQTLAGNWTPSSDGFAYGDPVEFGVVGGRVALWLVESAVLRWPAGNEVPVKIYPEGLRLMEGATFTLQPPIHVEVASRSTA